MSGFELRGGALFLPGEAPGALPIGTRVVKVAADPGGEPETTAIGQRGIVVASHAAPPEIPQLPGAPKAEFFYFVEWDWMPGVPVGVADWKLERET